MNLRMKFRILFAVILILVSVNALFYYYNTTRMNGLHQETLDYLAVFGQMTQTGNDMHRAIENYITSKSTTYIDDFYNSMQDFEALLNESQELEIKTEVALYLTNINNVLYGRYMPAGEKVISAIRGVNSDELDAYYMEFNKIKGYMDQYIDLMTEAYLDYNHQYRQVYALRSQKMMQQNILISLIITIFVGIAFRLLAISTVTQIDMLSKYAKNVSEGDYKTPIELGGSGEVALLGRTFNQLVLNTERYIDGVKKTAEIEKLLKEAELLSLQSQINPHFLFNTLNTISRLAIIEDAEDTCTLIESLAEMLRYNIRSFGFEVTIGDEIKNLENYFYIQKMRFSERIQYAIDIEPRLLEMPIPNLTLQPLVENAIVHGIENRKNGGHIFIGGEMVGDKAIITINDNGEGIAPERLAEIMNSDIVQKGHTMGIGLSNVKQRLELFYQQKDVFEIRSILGEGTTVTLRLEVNV